MGGKRYRRANLSNEPVDEEFEVIEALRRRLPSPPPGELWIGDDAAVISGGWVLTTDAMVQGVDWDPGLSSTADVGWKAVMVNASDLAAMGARPQRVLVALVAPTGFDVSGLYDGITEACAVLDAAVIGGDLSSPSPGSEAVVVSITALGRCPGHDAVTRAGAWPGNAVWATGAFGRAAAGLRMLRSEGAEDALCVQAHRRPRARVSEGLAAAAAGATSMIDVSDGLAADAWHLARSSNVTIALDGVPVANGATFDEAVAGGDDYELLCTAPPGVEIEGWVRLGQCRPGPPAVTVADQPLEPRGYRHWRTT
ncbi:MAG TPA: thiamine-phosphate kinase [Acidimicrobiales bacterium]|nr:thiamine-phosphate kinase [Acidimicrobiales bacterium]